VGRCHASACNRTCPGLQPHVPRPQPHALRWARDSLALHSTDPRDHVYSLAQLETSQTHEDIWNAAQTQLVQTGKMHGFMRMYWAKKVSP
jgi:deoxyribodipyrimidine photolyase